MTPFRLRRTLRHEDGREGTSLDNRTVHAPDVETAIDLAQIHRRAPPGMEFVSMMLCDPDGRVLWTSQDGGTFSPPEAAKIPPTPGP